MDRVCNHNPNSPETWMSILPLRRMVVPCKVFACCDVCGKVFEFIKNKNGGFEEAPKEEEDANV